MKKEKDFSKVYRTIFDDIYGYVYKRIANYADTEDIVEETFIALWESWESIEPASTRKYAFGIARNKIADHLRKHYRILVKLSEFKEEEDYGSPNVAKVKTKLNEYRTILNELIENLADREKSLILLKYQENKSFLQIAEELKITQNNAKVLHNRIIKKLQKLWIAKI